MGRRGSWHPHQRGEDAGGNTFTTSQRYSSRKSRVRIISGTANSQSSCYSMAHPQIQIERKVTMFSVVVKTYRPHACAEKPCCALGHPFCMPNTRLPLRIRMEDEMRVRTCDTHGAAFPLRPSESTLGWMRAISSAARPSATAHRSGSNRRATPADASGRSPLGTIPARAPNNAPSAWRSQNPRPRHQRQPQRATAATGVSEHGSAAPRANRAGAAAAAAAAVMRRRGVVGVAGRGIGEGKALSHRHAPTPRCLPYPLSPCAILPFVQKDAVLALTCGVGTFASRRTLAH
nr:unnamed protein product [Digitaria exilis]